MWTARQRAVVMALAIALLLYLSIRLAFQHTYISDPQPTEGLRAPDLQDRIDPNAAPQSQIAAIPSVGEKLAETIVAYREQWAKTHPGQPAFKELKDLLRIRGIGAARMETLAGYLVFPKSASTRP